MIHITTWVKEASFKRHMSFETVWPNLCDILEKTKNGDENRSVVLRARGGRKCAYLGMARGSILGMMALFRILIVVVT